jgi:Cysteine-rich secretory protein family
MMIKYGLIAILLTAAPTLAQAPQPQKPKAQSLNSRLLAAHNGARKAVSTAPLVWSDALASDARAWAETLAKTETFEHAPRPKDRPPQGENLWMGTAGSYSPEDMVGAWIEEKRYYRHGVFPKVSTTGVWADVGHYTQMIWHNTTHVGCAIIANANDEYLVCRYSPAGNWIGQDPQGSTPPAKQKFRKKSL